MAAKKDKIKIPSDNTATVKTNKPAPQTPAPEYKDQKLALTTVIIPLTIKIGTAVGLYFSNSLLSTNLFIYITISLLIDIAIAYTDRQKPELKNILAIIFSLNSALLISLVIYLSGWILSDYYLAYLAIIPLATLNFGLIGGLSSLILSILFYGSLLLTSHSPLIYGLRVLLMSVVSLSLFVNQLNFQKMGNLLKNMLSVEKSKKDFITIASHNLRTPIAAIYGYIDILLRGDPGKLNDQQSEFVNKIKSNNQELEKLTEQLLQISILELDKGLNLLKQPSQIEVLLEGVVENFMSGAKAKNLKLTFEQKEKMLPLVNIDPEKIRSVIINLIDNAIKYTEKGTVTVTAKKEGDFVVVSITDTGAGISSDELPKVFNKFYRSGDLLVYNKSGTGLGLYLGKQIIELHGGKMTVDSALDKGTAFTFTLPITTEEVES